MEEVDACEAEKHLPHLVERVRRGASVVITRHGVPVARLVPAPDAASAIAAVRTTRIGVTLGDDLRALRDDCRR
jgi:prevent-host-death family protein